MSPAHYVCEPPWTIADKIEPPVWPISGTTHPLCLQGLVSVVSFFSQLAASY